MIERKSDALSEFAGCRQRSYAEHARVLVLSRLGDVLWILDRECAGSGQDADQNGMFRRCSSIRPMFHSACFWQVMLGADNPRSIAYYAPEEVFGVACLRTTPGRIGDLEDVKGSFKLMDARTFKGKRRPW